MNKLITIVIFFSTLAFSEEQETDQLSNILDKVKEVQRKQEAHVLASKQVFQSSDPEERKEGFLYLRQEYVEGSAYSAGKLGWAYQHGLGVEADLSKAVEYYQYAASRGMTYWQILLSHAYENGYLGLPKDNEKALHWKNFEPKVHIAVYECWVATYYQNGTYPENKGELSYYEAECEKANK